MLVLIQATAFQPGCEGNVGKIGHEGLMASPADFIYGLRQTKNTMACMRVASGLLVHARAAYNTPISMIRNMLQQIH